MNTANRCMLLLMFAVLFANVLFAFWAESINVTVYSKDGQPMKNVTVTVIYQVNRCGAHSEIKKQTDEFGRVSFSFMNTVDESFGSCVERIYTIRADLGGYSNSTIGQVDRKDKNYQLWLPFLTHLVNVVNAANRSVANATITAFGINYSTNEAGNAVIFLPAGTTSEFIVSYGTISVKKFVNPSLKQVTTLSLPIYDLRVSLTDENGNPLVGKVRYKDIEKEITGNYVVFESFSDLNPTFYVTVGNVTHIINATVNSENLILRYDTLPPVISDVETRIANNKLYITATVVDIGKYASGITSNPILSYVGNASKSEGQKMYFVGNNKYETSIPLQGEEEIHFTITASDAQGNVETFSDVYYVSLKIEKEIEKATKGFSWLTFIGILAFVIIVYVIYLKIKEQTQ